VVAQSALSADGLRIAYERHGDKGPVLVLVHGWTNNRSFWEPHPESLARDFQVVTLDLPGFGESGNGRDIWTMEGFGQDVAAVVAALGADPVFLVGFSMGGAAVLEAAAVLEDRVAGVVLVDVFHDVNQRYDRTAIDTFVERQMLCGWRVVRP
jgi:pimeloyl-ACP methyl ester carboxylesterase